MSEWIVHQERIDAVLLLSWTWVIEPANCNVLAIELIKNNRWIKQMLLSSARGSTGVFALVEVYVWVHCADAEDIRRPDSAPLAEMKAGCRALIQDRLGLLVLEVFRGSLGCFFFANTRKFWDVYRRSVTPSVLQGDPPEVQSDVSWILHLSWYQGIFSCHRWCKRQQNELKQPEETGRSRKIWVFSRSCFPSLNFCFPSRCLLLNGVSWSDAFFKENRRMIGPEEQKTSLTRSCSMFSIVSRTMSVCLLFSGHSDSAGVLECGTGFFPESQDGFLVTDVMCFGIFSAYITFPLYPFCSRRLSGVGLSLLLWSDCSELMLANNFPFLQKQMTARFLIGGM